MYKLAPAKKTFLHIFAGVISLYASLPYS